MRLRAKTFHVPFLILVSFYAHLPAYEDGTKCSETSAYKIQAPGNYPKESIQHTENGVSLKLRMRKLVLRWEKYIERQGDYVEK